MFRNLLFMMSLSGTVVCLLYIITYPLAKRYFPLKWRYRMLKTVIIFFLIPFSECKYLISGVIHDVFPDLWKRILQPPDIIDSEMLIILNNNLIQFTPKARCMFSGILIVEIIAFFIIWRQTIQYRKIKQIYLGTSKKTPDPQQEKLFLKSKDDLKIKRDIMFFCSEYCKSPMTSGVLRPVIFFPMWNENRINADSCEYMIRHELVHIKHHDLLIKFMGILVMSIHWFNPFSYFLYYELSSISEMYCDSIVMQNKGHEDRCKYGALILEFAAENEFPNKNKLFSGVANSKNKIVYRRRLLEIFTDRKYKIILSMAMMGFICIAGGITAFAYDSPKVLTDNEKYDGESIVISTKLPVPEYEELPYDCFFIDSNGKISNIGNSNKKPKSVCIHNYTSGSVTKHKGNGKDECTVKVYKAKMCEICGDIVTSELLSTTTYPHCPH